MRNQVFKNLFFIFGFLFSMNSVELKGISIPDFSQAQIRLVEKFGKHYKEKMCDQEEGFRYISAGISKIENGFYESDEEQLNDLLAIIVFGIDLLNEKQICLDGLMVSTIDNLEEYYNMDEDVIAELRSLWANKSPSQSRSNTNSDGSEEF